MHRLRFLLLMMVVAAAFVAFGPSQKGSQEAHAESAPHIASGFDYVKYATSPAVCDGAGLRFSYYWLKGECGFLTFQVSNTEFGQSTVIVRFLDKNDRLLDQALAEESTSAISGVTSWAVPISPGLSWPSGAIKVEVTVFGDTSPAGVSYFYLNHLEAEVTVAPSPDGRYLPGDPLLVTGTISQVVTELGETQKLQSVPARFFIQVTGPNGVVKGPYGPYTAASNGTFSQGLPRSATSAFAGTYETDFKSTIQVEIIDATYSDLLTGEWVGEEAGTTPVELVAPPDRLFVETSFVSSVGWVKPGETYPFRVFVKNFTEDAVAGAVAAIPPVDGTTFTKASPLPGQGTATVNPDGSISWELSDVGPGLDGNATVMTLVAEGRADSLDEDPQIVWKDISATTTLTYPGAPGEIASTSHGPKVIPPDETYDTARYGFRPFPVVPVDFFDRSHEDGHAAEKLESVINSPDIEGSTFNLYQEMSYGQLFPNADVPSAGIVNASWAVDWNSPRYQESGFAFSELTPQGACYGLTYSALTGSPVYESRINDGWYQLPGDTAYYGADRYTGAGSLAGAQIGLGAIFQIDDACGPTGKAVYDAAHIADPEIDYSDFDTDKDGVVDFFMMVFPGIGGNGESLICCGYDNIWPHSSSLEFYFNDPETGQPGYVSDDQLKDLEGNLLYYTDGTRTTMTSDVTDYPVYVRVGPYNVNPEDAIDHASVISHEYGHSLGLPDFYSLGTRSTYGDWNLMATDKSQHMDVFSKQELGWIVPNVLTEGETVVSDWQDSKANTHEINWVQPDGTPYTLSGPNVDNGEAYVAKLPGRQIIDPAKVEEGASASHVWWSGSGNDYGCPPLKGRNLDIALPELEAIPEGTPVTLTFKSYFDIEWDYDYGFVLTSTDGGETYSSVASANGYTTPAAQNPTANACQAQYGNGITGTSGSYAAGTQELDRVLGEYPDGGFIEDQYDLTALAGQASVLRFTYATDPGLARPGWFIDDVTITAGDDVIYQTDFEEDADPRIFNGGCGESMRTAAFCTAGWKYINASSESPADHAYYLEMRDRSGFDYDSHGQNNRDELAFEPGLLLTYTDETHGYGNVGTDDPPAQSPLDSVPEPGSATPNLNDAAFKASGARNVYSDWGGGHTDNYNGDATGTIPWVLAFDCLSFEVLSMSGDGVGPATAPGDLTGDVRFNIGSGCGSFNYGYGDFQSAGDSPPTAVAQAKPSTVKTDKWVRLDGSRSYDDFTAPNDLEYRWDVNGDGVLDAEGQRVRISFDTPGVRNVALQVTDSRGQTSQTTVAVEVVDRDQR